MPSWENLNSFFNLKDFGVPVVVHLSKGGVLSIAGIFDAKVFDATIGEYTLDHVQPRLTCKSSDVALVIRGDVAEIEGKKYDVLANADSDGTGLSVLELASQDV